MRGLRTVARLSISTLAIPFIALSCDGAKPVQPVDNAHAHLGSAAGAAVRFDSDLANSVRPQMARFNSVTQAIKAGYVESSPCIASPEGGMGFHYVNQSLVDPVFDPMKPEALVYAPKSNGQLKLVALEYIVIDVDQPAPTFDGQPFDVGGTPVPVDHWSLHAWLFESNPSGVFNPWNPAVTCP
jgi:hypothetical protein